MLALAAMAVAGMAGGLRLGLWVDEAPGAGLFPLLTGAFLFAFVALRAVRRREAQVAAAETGASALRPAVYVVALAALALPMPRLGFPLAAMIALMIVLVVAERQAPLRALILASCMVGATLILFDYGLGVPLPWGPLSGLRAWAN